MNERIEADVAVVGAGAGGLVVAAATAMLGQRAVLIERGLMGGDCLNYGCVPSKALLAAAKQAVAHETAAGFGVHFPPPRIDFAAVMGHVRETIAAIAPHDSMARYTALGVTVLQGSARFTAPDRLACGDKEVVARRFVVATGSTPLIPPIPGLAGSGFLTNETIFDLATLPSHLVILGGGGIGIELAQAFRRLGSVVTIIEAETCLAREDPELAALVLDALRREGVAIREGARAANVAKTTDGVAVTLARGEAITGSHLLVATGRKPAVEGLGLDAAGIAVGPQGIAVDAGLRTTNRKVYAIGDVTGLMPLTSVAGYHAGLVVRSALFRLPVKADHRAIPRAIYTDPELAAVGLSEAEARTEAGRITILRWPFAANDRALAERRGEGLVKAIVAPNGRLLGAAIVGKDAGDLIQPWALALQRKLGIGALQAMAAAYPTRSEAAKRAAGEFYKSKLLSPFTRGLVQFLARFG